MAKLNTTQRGKKQSKKSQGTFVLYGEKTVAPVDNVYVKERGDLLAGYSGNAARRDETYARETGEVSADVSQELREAYVAAKNSGRQLPQVMSAKGLSGGVSDLAARRVQSGYNTLRSELTAERDKRLAALQEEYLQGGQKDREAYQLKLNALNKRYKLALERLA